jgi:hypothetical protein
MKILRRLLILFILSLIIATGLFFINSNVIVKNSFADKIGEIIFLAVPVFIIITILYYVNKALVRSVKGLKNKKPSGGEGLNR